MQVLHLPLRGVQATGSFQQGLQQAVSLQVQAWTVMMADRILYTVQQAHEVAVYVKDSIPLEHPAPRRERRPCE
jgi:hypothetical protein